MDGEDRFTLIDKKRILYECIPCKYQVLGTLKNYISHKHCKKCLQSRKRTNKHIPLNHFIKLRYCMFEIRYKKLKSYGFMKTR